MQQPMCVEHQQGDRGEAIHMRHGRVYHGLRDEPGTECDHRKYEGNDRIGDPASEQPFAQGQQPDQQPGERS